MRRFARRIGPGLAVTLALVATASIAHATAFTIDGSPSTPGTQPVDSGWGGWSVDPVSDLSGAVSAVSGTLTDPVSQDWIVFDVSAHAVDLAVLKMINLEPALGFGYLGPGSVAPSDAGVVPWFSTQANEFDFRPDPLLPGESTRLVLGFGAGTLVAQVNPANVNWQSSGCFDGTSCQDLTVRGWVAHLPEPGVALLLGGGLGGMLLRASRT